MPNVYKSNFLGYVVCVLRNLHVWTFFYEFRHLDTKTTISLTRTAPPLLYIVIFSLFMSWKNVLICFRTFSMGGQNLQKVRELRTDYQKLEHRKKAGPLTAPQLWKLKHLSYLKPFYKQCHKSVQGSGAVGGASITSTEQESDEDQEPELDDRGHESSSSSRNETSTKIPVLNCPTQNAKT